VRLSRSSSTVRVGALVGVRYGCCRTGNICTAPPREAADRFRSPLPVAHRCPSPPPLGQGAGRVAGSRQPQTGGQPILPPHLPAVPGRPDRRERPPPRRGGDHEEACKSESPSAGPRTAAIRELRGVRARAVRRSPHGGDPEVATAEGRQVCSSVPLGGHQDRLRPHHIPVATRAGRRWSSRRGTPSRTTVCGEACAITRMRRRRRYGSFKLAAYSG
jgi:hypothetical protein